jgi:hypothetical protein
MHDTSLLAHELSACISNASMGCSLAHPLQKLQPGAR